MSTVYNADLPYDVVMSYDGDSLLFGRTTSVMTPRFNSPALSSRFVDSVLSGSRQGTPLNGPSSVSNLPSKQSSTTLHG